MNHCDSSGYQGGPCQSFSLSDYQECISFPSQFTCWAQAETLPTTLAQHSFLTVQHKHLTVQHMAQISEKS